MELPNMDLKYFGKKQLFKIAGIMGKPIKLDIATALRAELMYVKAWFDKEKQCIKTKKKHKKVWLVKQQLDKEGF